MIENAGALDVYFEDEIEILIEDPDQFSVAAAKQVLTELEVEYTSIAVAD